MPGTGRDQEGPGVVPGVAPATARRAGGRAEFHSGARSVLAREAIVLFALVSKARSVLGVGAMRELVSTKARFVLGGATGRGSVRAGARVLYAAGTLGDVGVRDHATFKGAFHFN